MSFASADAPACFAPGSEYVIASQPFTVRRIVRWAECDPAGVVYLGNYPGYLLSAIHLFRERIFETGWISQGNARGYQAPGKAIAMVFQSSLWPDDAFNMKVYVGDLRTRTMDICVAAVRADDGRPVFAGSITTIYVTMEDRRVAIAIPEEVRQAADAYAREAPLPDSIRRALRQPDD